MITWHKHTYESHPHAVEHRWCGEYWSDDEDTGAPWGVCWVLASPGFQPVIWMVLVEDRFRRRGVATALIADARKRWPGIMVTEGVTPAGEALYDSLPDE